jgi:hypothetical protein
MADVPGLRQANDLLGDVGCGVSDALDSLALGWSRLLQRIGRDYNPPVTNL